MSDKTQSMIDRSKTLQEIIAESMEVDDALSDKYGDEAPALAMHAAIGSMADQLEKQGLLDKKEWLLESISRRREMLA